MKKILFIVCISLTITNCKAQTKTEKNNSEFASFGAKISPENAVSTHDLTHQYGNMKPGDTLNVKFISTIKTVCQNKGCWMKVALDHGEETFVKFKDYGFFMPKDSKDKTVIINGKAFVSEESIEDQKHYAGDAGKPKSEIDKITTTKKTLSFLSDGVLIKN